MRTPYDLEASRGSFCERNCFFPSGSNGAFKRHGVARKDLSTTPKKRSFLTNLSSLQLNKSSYAGISPENPGGRLTLKTFKTDAVAMNNWASAKKRPEHFLNDRQSLVPTHVLNMNHRLPKPKPPMLALDTVQVFPSCDKNLSGLNSDELGYIASSCAIALERTPSKEFSGRSKKLTMRLLKLT